MGGEIVAAGIGLGLHDCSRGRPVDEDLAQEVARDVYGRAIVEGAFEDGAETHRFIDSTDRPEASSTRLGKLKQS